MYGSLAYISGARRMYTHGGPIISRARSARGIIAFACARESSLCSPPPRLPPASCKRVFNFLYPFLQGVAGTPGKNGFPVYYFLFSFHSFSHCSVYVALFFFLSFFRIIMHLFSISLSLSLFLYLYVSLRLSLFFLSVCLFRTPRLSPHCLSYITVIKCY